MFGITFDTWEFFESIPENKSFSNLAFQIDAGIFQHQYWQKKLKKLQFASLSVRNPVNTRLNRLILESPFKLQTDYLESLAKQLDLYNKSAVTKVMFDFDLAGIFGNDFLCEKLLTLLGSIKGIAAENNIKVELLFRLPFAAMADFIISAAKFRQTTLLGMDFAVDMHIHEAGFVRDDIIDLLLPIEYDIKSVNFIYDAALGNKINIQNLLIMTDKFNHSAFLLYTKRTTAFTMTTFNTDISLY